MAASICRQPVLTTCKLFERLLPNGSAISRLPTNHSCRRSQVHRTVHNGIAPSLFSKYQETCSGVFGVVIVPHRNVSWYTDKRISRNLGAVGVPQVDPDVTVLGDEGEGQELSVMVNTSMEKKEHGRLFAVVSVNGVQRKLTTEDVLVVVGDFPPSVGDRIRLEKVLMIGGKDFSLLGQPLLSRDQVRVEATVIEKTLSQNKVWSTYKPRQRFRRLKLFREPHTMIVINSIQLNTVSEHTQ
ncbi:large ribosomal subunit protein bL21m-like [Littorina saxatilis]|uniref:Large ribosomal subunit protein bL21m n=1 Tax=Littorina saxatilis TaxID=31220 RepID=A0AAN9BPM2_9CAEN